MDMLGEQLPTYLDEFMRRIVATELENLSRLRQIDAKPFFLWFQEGFPYITHRLGRLTPDDISADLQERTYRITGRFVCGHVSEGGWNGDNELLIYQFEPVIVNLFTNNVYLLSDEYEEPMEEMDSDGITYLPDTGTGVFDNRGTKLPQQVGFEFSIQAKFILDVNRQYSAE